MKKNAMSAILAVCAALGWWGALYPQFTLLQGTYEIVYEEDECSDGTQEKDSADSEQYMGGTCDYDELAMSANALYWQILDADCSRIRFKSRLLTNWHALQEQRREVNGSGDK